MQALRLLAWFQTGTRSAQPLWPVEALGLSLAQLLVDTHYTVGLQWEPHAAGFRKPVIGCARDDDLSLPRKAKVKCAARRILRVSRTLSRKIGLTCTLLELKQQIEADLQIPVASMKPPV